MKEEIGKRLEECRKMCGMTQKEVANLLEVAQPVYSRFEKGIFECNYSQIVKLCDIFDISADYFFGRSDL